MPPTSPRWRMGGGSGSTKRQERRLQDMNGNGAGNVPIAGKNCLTITMTLIIELRFASVTAAARRWTEVQTTRLIAADKLNARLFRNGTPYYTEPDIENAPTVDAAPIRHGRRV